MVGVPAAVGTPVRLMVYCDIVASLLFATHAARPEGCKHTETGLLPVATVPLLVNCPVDMVIVKY